MQLRLKAIPEAQVSYLSGWKRINQAHVKSVGIWRNTAAEIQHTKWWEMGKQAPGIQKERKWRLGYSEMDVIKADF